MPRFLQDIPGIALQLAVGAGGGFLALLLGLPMPFLIGSLLAVGLISMVAEARFATVPAFPELLRRSFVCIIGVLIGLSFSPELLGSLADLWLSVLVLALFVPVAFAVSYAVYRGIGGYDRPTAVFASMPGGLIEAISIGEQAGGNVAILTVQHFARITLVVVVVPALFWFWSGEAVGSAAGESLSATTYGSVDIIRIVLIALVGIVLGKKMRLPAGVLTGPLLLSAVLHGGGLAVTQSPGWLLNLAQMVVGTGLGATFAGISRRQLIRSFSLGLLAMALVLCIALMFAVGLSHFTEISAEVLFISYTPGGVTEMSLIALSLGISPILVAAHHLFRIAITVVLMSVLAKRLD